MCLSSIGRWMSFRRKSDNAPEECRPDQDVLVRRRHQKEQKVDRRRGKLKIFVGATADVGETYKMLEEARWMN